MGQLGKKQMTAYTSVVIPHSVGPASLPAADGDGALVRAPSAATI